MFSTIGIIVVLGFCVSLALVVDYGLLMIWNTIADRLRQRLLGHCSVHSRAPYKGAFWIERPLLRAANRMEHDFIALVLFLAATPILISVGCLEIVGRLLAAKVRGGDGEAKTTCDDCEFNRVMYEVITRPLPPHFGQPPLPPAVS